MHPYKKLKNIFKRISQLHYLQRILMWDEAVMMPKGAGKARAKALATLVSTIQKKLIAKNTYDLINRTENDTQNFSPWDAANFYWMQKLHTRAIAVPVKLIEKATSAQIASEQAWREKRVLNDWSNFLPYLEKSFYYTKEIAERRAEILGVDPYDALLDEYAPGFNQQIIDPLFNILKQELPQLADQIIAKQTKINITSQGSYEIDKQKALALTVMADLGFDFNHGRLDVSHHPFCSGGPKDVRLTTRYSEQDFFSSLLAVCHETGHALYEQGLPKLWINQPVGAVHSMAMHESQSLLIEMEVCRSKAFYEYLSPILIAFFGLQDVFQPEVLHAIGIHVEKSFIRVDADEVTYPLHIILRYELEKALFNGKLTIKDLPAAWDELMQKYFSLSTKNNDANGVMQDVHWPSGAFGYFPAYTLGRMIAAQLFARFSNLHTGFESEIRQGRFHMLIDWLHENIYSQASVLPTQDLLSKITGEQLNPQFFIDGLKRRYLS